MVDFLYGLAVFLVILLNFEGFRIYSGLMLCNVQGFRILILLAYGIMIDYDELIFCYCWYYNNINR